MRPTYPVTELLGDGIGAELSEAVHVLADVLPIHLDFAPVDLTLENRRAKGKAVYDHAVESVCATRFALKYPTVTAEESPNAVLRRRLDLSVIHRPVYTIPGVPTNFTRPLDIDIIRIATGGTYDDPSRRDRRRGRREPADRRAEAGVRGRPLRLRPRPQDRQARYFGVEAHDSEGHRRPVRAGHARSRPQETWPRPTRSTCSTPCSASSS